MKCAGCCPICGAHDKPQAPVDPVAKLRAWFTERGHHIGPGDEVDEHTAAAALDLSIRTLQDWRYRGKAPAHRIKRGRAWYSVTALAKLT